MRHLATAFLLIAPLGYAETLSVFGQTWTVPIASEWKVENSGDSEVLRMLVAKPQQSPRRPIQFILSQTDWQKVRLEVEARRLGGSLILVYAYKDPAHFNYAHVSVDTAVKQPVHNGIFHVYGGDRVRISPDDGPSSLPDQDKWYKLILDYDATTGLATVTVDGQTNTSLRGIDLSLGAGKIGLGSFFETALFRNLKVTGTPAR